MSGTLWARVDSHSHRMDSRSQPEPAIREAAGEQGSSRSALPVSSFTSTSFALPIWPHTFRQPDLEPSRG